MNLLPISSIASHFHERRSEIRHNYSTRNRVMPYQSIVPFEFLSSYAQKSIAMKRHVVWDGIPNDVRYSESLNCFKRNYKSFLIESM